MTRDKFVKVGDSGIGYNESGDYALFVVTWILGQPDKANQPSDTVFFRTGIVMAKDIPSLRVELDAVSKSSYHEFLVLDVRFIEFVTLLEDMNSEWRAYQVIDQFDQNVDKDDGDK